MTAKTTDFSGLLYYNPAVNGFNPIVEATVTGPTTINEGATATFNAVTWNIPNGPVYWWINSLTNITTDRIAPGLAAEATILNNRSSFSVAVSADDTTASGAQSYTINFGKVQNTALQSITVTVSDTSQSTPIPQSLIFNGSSDYKEVLGTTSDWALGTTWTMEYWSKHTTASGPGTIYTVMCQNYNGNGIDIIYQDAKIKINNGTVLADEPTPGVWTHVALVNNAGVMTLYYNGTSVYTGGNWNLGNTTDTLMIGRRGPGNFQFFPGKLTGIRITNTAVYSTPRYVGTIDFGYGAIKITVNDVGAVYLQFQASAPTITNQLTVGARVVLDWDGRPGNTVAVIAGPSIDFPGNPYPGSPGFLLTIVSTTELPGNSEAYNIEALTVIPVFDPYTVALPPTKVAGTRLLMNPTNLAYNLDLSDSAHTLSGSSGGGGDYPVYVPPPTAWWNGIYIEPISEGTEQTIDIGYSNWDGSTIYWTLSGGTSTGADFNVTSGVFIGLTGSGMAKIHFTPTADLTTEGTQTYYVNVGTTLGGNEIAGANSGPYNISDTSLSQTGLTVNWLGTTAIVAPTGSFTSPATGTVVLAENAFVDTGHQLPTNNIFSITIDADLGTPSSYWSTIWGNDNYSSSGAADYGWFAYLNDAEHLQFGSFNGAIRNISLPPGLSGRNVWTFVVAGLNIDFYLNGSQISTGSLAGSAPAMANNNLYIGSRHNNSGGAGPSDARGGTYYSVRVRDTVLTSQQAYDEYAAIFATW